MRLREWGQDRTVVRILLEAVSGCRGRFPNERTTNRTECVPVKLKFIAQLGKVQILRFELPKYFILPTVRTVLKTLSSHLPRQSPLSLRSSRGLEMVFVQVGRKRDIVESAAPRQGKKESYVRNRS